MKICGHSQDRRSPENLANKPASLCYAAGRAAEGHWQEADIVGKKEL